MSESQETTFTCPHHGVMEERVKNMERTGSRIEENQKEHYETQRRFMRELSQTMNDFIQDTNEEIMGSKGPEGKPGLKPLVHSNRRDILELRKENEVRTKKDSEKQRVLWVSIIAPIITGLVVIGLALLLFSKNIN